MHVLVVQRTTDNIIDGIPAATLESVTKAIAAVTEKTGIKGWIPCNHQYRTWRSVS